MAEVLNAGFVSIKVDREERPDVDRVYMTFVQATTGSGGWPMSVWLTPSLEPFYGGTYFPPTSRWGRPGFVEILEELARAWREDRGRASSRRPRRSSERLRGFGQSARRRRRAGAEALDRAVAEFEAAFDRRRGGFGNAPKFPRPSELLFLLREHARTGADAPLAMTLATLRAMALGGMRDHIGGGFHRYSVDGDWRVPHFEKMLYDQAQLVLAYLEAAQATGDAVVRRRGRGHARLRAPRPDASRRAGSIRPRMPTACRPSTRDDAGAPTRWKARSTSGPSASCATQLGADAEVFCQRFGVQPGRQRAVRSAGGVHRQEPALHGARALADIAADTGVSEAEVEAALARSRGVLLDVRGRRPRPHLDDKVLAAWNGLMIAAFARAGRVVPGGDVFIARGRARRASSSSVTSGTPASRTLLRRYRGGERGGAGLRRGLRLS